MADQALFSGASFLVSILLARWLHPEEYGAFAVALSVFYLVAGFHTAVLTEPMMVFGTGHYRKYFRKYLGMLLYGHWGLTAVIALLLGVSAFVMRSLRSEIIAQALVGLALALPFLLLIWLTRRACYAQMRPLWSVVGSGTNLVVALGGAFLLRQEGMLNSLSALVLLGSAGGAASLVLMLRLRPRLLRLKGNPTPAKVVRDHWNYGSWNLLSVVAYWLSGQILMLLIPAFLGLTASAAVAAVSNLYRPISLLMQSVGLILLPTFSRWGSGGMAPNELKQYVRHFATIFGGIALFYGALCTVMAKPVLHLLYAGKYDGYWLLVGLFGLSTAFSVVTGLFLLGVKARGDTQAAFKIWGLSALLVSLSSIPLVRIAGLEGAVFSVVMSYSVACWMAYARLDKALETTNTGIH